MAVLTHYFPRNINYQYMIIYKSKTLQVSRNKHNMFKLGKPFYDLTTCSKLYLLGNESLLYT